MNLRVDLILPTERRSGSAVSSKFVARFALILAPTLLGTFLLFQFVKSNALARELAGLAARFSEIQPQQEIAKTLSTEYQTHLAIQKELQAWQNSRVAWHDQLAGLVRCMPANMQLQSLSVRQSLQLTPDDKPARLFVMDLGGKATGTTAEQSLKSLQAQLLGAPAFTSQTSAVSIPLFAQDPAKDSARDDRVFQITCQYVERVFLMRLPEDRTERIKILVLIVIGCIAVVFMLVTLLVKPLLSRNSQRREEISTLSAKLTAAEADVGRMLTERDGNIRVLAEVVDIANHEGYILEPRLGNYELGAHEFVDAASQAAGVSLLAVQELGITLLPQAPKSKIEHALKCYGIHVTLRAGALALHALLNEIESQNPFVVVSGLTITARAEDPAQHDVGLDLQWPIWSDPMRSRQLEQRLKECRSAIHANTELAPEG